MQMSPLLRCPPPNEAVEIRCHIYSKRAEDGPPRIWLQAVFVKRASIRAVPKLRATLNALRRKEAISQTPFASREDVIQELEATHQLERTAIESLLSPGKVSRGQESFLNKVVLSGVLGNKQFIQPAEDSFDDFGALRFELYQSGDPKEALHITLPGAGRNFSSNLGKMYRPLAVVAQIKADPVLDDESNVLDRHLRLETTNFQVFAAQLSRDFEGGAFPSWWREIANRQSSGAPGSKAGTAPAVIPATSSPASPAAQSVAAAAVEPDMDFMAPEEEW